MTETAQRFEAATAATIDPADLEKDRAAIVVLAASRSQVLISTATPEAIRNFANGYGDDIPLYTDLEYHLHMTPWDDVEDEPEPAPNGPTRFLGDGRST